MGKMIKRLLVLVVEGKGYKCLPFMKALILKVNNKFGKLCNWYVRKGFSYVKHEWRKPDGDAM